MTGMGIETAADRKRTVCAAVLRCATVVALRAFEERQQVIVTPARVTLRPPRIEASAMTTNMDHRIDGARSAVNLAPRCGALPLQQPRLRLGHVGPVVLRADERGPPSRCCQRRILFARRARLDHAHPDR